MTNVPTRPKAGASPFWFMNAVMNPLVRTILRSPLHGILSASTLLITVRGRKSGAAYTIPVQYAQADCDAAIYIVPGAPERKTWWRNLRGGAPVTLNIRGKVVQAQAKVLSSDTDGAAIVTALQVYFRAFPTSAQIAHVSRTADGGFDAGDLQTAAGQMVVVRVAP